MRRNLMITLAVVGAIAVFLYAAHSMDLVGMIIRGHGGMAGVHGG
jgi:hypothetical protein